MTRLSFFLLLSIVFLCSSGTALYEGSKSNKPVAELELMNDSELLSEMMEVCLSVAMLTPLYGPRFHLEGLEYVQLIGRVSRKQHGGKSLKWTDALFTATAEGSQQKCERAHSVGSEENKREYQRKSRNP